jgi:hypothetical protein
MIDGSSSLMMQIENQENLEMLNSNNGSRHKAPKNNNFLADSRMVGSMIEDFSLD